MKVIIYRKLIPGSDNFNRTQRFLMSLIAIIVFYAQPAHSQEVRVGKTNSSLSTYDELRVTVFLKNSLSFDTDILISENEIVYYNIEDLFKNLRIQVVKSGNGQVLGGFLENESKRYEVDYANYLIKSGTYTKSLKEGLVEEFGIKYVDSKIIEEAFGIKLSFSQRSLSVQLEASFELPFVKQMRIENTRNSISKLQGEQQAIVDTIIPRNYHLFKGGMFDWGLSSNQLVGGISTNNVLLGLGGELLFGETNVSINFNDKYPFDNRQLQYNWRWIDNDKRFVKQAQVGKIITQSISFLSAPVIGARVTNSPSTVRKAEGSYTITDYTEPDWTVELYINNVLVDYTTADASGLFAFKVPIVYGYTTLRLKFYGTQGEERSEERIMNTPYTFLPNNTFEYNLSGGVLQDGNQSRFGKGDFNYGVNRFLTIGGGVEYLSSIPDRPYIPFVKAAFQPFSKMIMTLEYAQNVSFKGLLNYYFTKSAFLELDYTKFEEGQLATRFNALEERRIRVSVPFKYNHLSGFAKINLNQLVYKAFNYNQIDMVYSAFYGGWNLNSSTIINWIDSRSPYLTSMLALSYRIRNGVVLRQTAEYNLSLNAISRYKSELEKRFTNKYLSVSYERNAIAQNDNVFMSFKYELPYARAGMSAFYSNKTVGFSENAQGSLAFGGGNNYVHSSNTSSLGKGGVLFYPFLDLNQNGIRDKGEKMVLLSTVIVSGGNVNISKKDSIVRISDLNGFVNYNVQFLDRDLENISWRFKHNNYQVQIDPNQYKRVDVPVISIGEVNGMIYLNKENVKKGLGRVTVQIYDNLERKVAETLSESDGYFSYLGLKSGNYSVRIDKEQLEKLNYQCTPNKLDIVIEVSEEGTIVERQDFQVEPKQDEESSEKVLDEASLQVKEETVLEKIAAKPIEKITDTKELFYSIKVGIYKDHVVPKELLNLDTVFYEDLMDGNVQYYYGFFRTLERAFIAKNALVLRGIVNTSIVTYQFGKQIDRSTSVIEKEEEAKEKIISVKSEGVISTKTNTSFGRIFDIKEDFFSVQIGVFENYVPSKRLLYFNPVYYEFIEDSLIRYISGKFRTYAEARKMKFKIKNKGIKDAYIVEYRNGVRFDSRKN